MPELTVTDLFIYPVKSMRGIRLEHATLTHKGLLHDRRWMVVKDNGQFLTQREVSQMALIETSLSETGLVLSMSGQGSIEVPYDQNEGEIIETVVWGAKCLTIDQGQQVSHWLTRALDDTTPLRLVSMKPGYIRPQKKPQVLGTHTTTDFADAAPYLLANESSLEKLNSILLANQSGKVPMNRFRPNIVVRGLDPFDEHNLAAVIGDSYQLKACYPCERCVITTIDQSTAIKDPHHQPFKTLQEINPMPGSGRAPAFAENVTLTSGDGQLICVGDNIRAEFKTVITG